MKTVLTQQELADRWGVTVKALTDWRNAKVIEPIMGIPVIRFSKEYIEELEGVTIEKFSPLERKRMEMELEKLKHQNGELKKILGNVLSEGCVVGAINFKEYKLEYVKMEDDEDWKMYRLIKKD